MRIVISGYFLLHPATGSGQYTAALIRALGRLCQEEMAIVCPRGTAHLAGSLLVGREGPWKVVALGLPFPGDLGKLWFEQVGLPLACRSLDADLLHVPYLGPPLAKPCRTVVTIHDLIMHLFPETRRSLQARLYTRLAALAAKRADFILADSLATREDVLRVLRLAADKVRVVYLAGEETLGPVEEESHLQAVRRKYGLEPGFLLYLGGLDWRKNLPRLLRAFSTLPRPPQLALAGAALSRRLTSFPDLVGLARGLGIQDRVVFLGQVPEEDKAPLYSACLAFVFPSLYEGFGLPPLEAMACGAPVACSRASSLPEVVGEAALLFNPTDEQDMASVLAQVLESEELRQEMRRKGLQQASRFTWRRTAEETLAVYGLAGGGPASPVRIWGNQGLSRWNTALRRAQAEVGSRGGRVLEVGCGAGRFMRALKGDNPKAAFFGCDLDIRALAVGRSQGDGVRYVGGDLHALPYQDGQFGTVLLFDVLEHLQKPRRALGEVHRVLEAGGLLHALVPCEGQPGSLHWLLGILRLGGDLKERHSGHVQRFTRRGLLRLLRESGFRVERVTYSMHPLGQVRDVLSYVEREHWFRRWRRGKGLYRGMERLLWGAAYLESNLLLKEVPLGAVALHVTAKKGAAP